MSKPAVSPQQFTNFGDLLKYLRRRVELTQSELAIQVGYSDTQISRLEQNQRVPDAATLKAWFVPALHLQYEAEWAERLLELAKAARLETPPDFDGPERSKLKNNLPAMLTSFVGREQVQKEISTLLTKNRLVTLTGSGGVGKTRTALQVGGKILDEYVNGVWFVELAALTDGALVPATVATVLGASLNADISPSQSLVDFLRARTVLLILDNCEHVLEASAALAEVLLKYCPQIKILATSREALGMLGEINYRLPSLGLPDSQHPLDEFWQYETVRLFEARAQLAQPSFKVTLENAAAVAQICTRLDGIPLAIELAAARVNIFSPEQIAARLDDRFNLLTGGSRTGLARQQTIRASIDWSWALLSDAERTLLRRLTIFVGGWTLEAAEAICGRVAERPFVVANLLAQLIAKSLVNAEYHSRAESRFHLHETIRAYAYEKLAEAGDEQDLRYGHLHYFLELVNLGAPAINGPQQMEWLGRLKDERGNLQSALDYAAKNNLEAGLLMVAALHGYWRIFDLQAGLKWTSQLTDNPASQTFPYARAKARCTLGQILLLMQQFEQTRLIAEECLRTFREYGDKEGEYDSLILLGNVLQYFDGLPAKATYHHQALALARSMGDVLRQGNALEFLAWSESDLTQSRAYRAEAIRLFRQLGHWLFLARTLSFQGFFDVSNGELESAERLLNEADEINRQIDDRQGREFILTGKSYLCLLGGDYQQARALQQEDIDIKFEMGNRMGYLWGRARLGYISLREGNVAEARQIFTEVIENFHADRNKSGLAFTLDKLASLYVKIGLPAVAAQLIGWSDVALKEIGENRTRINQDDIRQDVATIVAHLGSAAYEAAYNAGQTMRLDELVTLALKST